MSKSTAVFYVYDVSFSYGGIPALKNVSLDVHHGERLALLGANGSGKSTLLRLLAGLSYPTHGSIYFSGSPLSEESLAEEQAFYRFRRQVGVLFQNPDVQLFNASVFDEVAFGPLQLGWEQSQIRRRVEQTLDQLGISDLRDRPPHRLSGGEKKRVALASVLVSDPAILLLDEPAASLDGATETTILDLLSDWKGTGRTVVIATHDLATIEAAADRCLILHDGAVLATGTPFEILHNLPLLTKAFLVRPHSHSHEEFPGGPHSHFHAGEIK